MNEQTFAIVTPNQYGSGQQQEASVSVSVSRRIVALCLSLTTAGINDSKMHHQITQGNLNKFPSKLFLRKVTTSAHR